MSRLGLKLIHVSKRGYCKVQYLAKIIVKGTTSIEVYLSLLFIFTELYIKKSWFSLKVVQCVICVRKWIIQITTS